MDVLAARDKFISTWGEMAAKWGVNKTMGQIHALMLISPEPLCTDDAMEALDISRGNACMNIKALLEWGLIYKANTESRKEHYIAEKEMITVFKQIILHRKKEELEPLLHLMEDCSSVEDSCKYSKEFCKVVNDIRHFSIKADATLDTLLKTNPNWFVNTFIRMLP